MFRHFPWKGRLLWTSMDEFIDLICDIVASGVLSEHSRAFLADAPERQGCVMLISSVSTQMPSAHHQTLAGSRSLSSELQYSPKRPRVSERGWGGASRGANISE